MKRKTLHRFILISLLMAALLTTAMVTLAQEPPHPNGGIDPTVGNSPVGGGAPVGNGVLVLLSLAAGYGIRKRWTARARLLN
jgi:hypothetical protein